LLVGLVAFTYGSSHSEAPGTAKMPQSDATDFYMFRSYEPSRISDDYVTFIVNIQGLQSPYAGPNYFSFSDAHYYEIYIDNNGDAVEDKIYQFMYGTAFGGPMRNQSINYAEFDCGAPPPFTQYAVLPGGIEVPVDSTHSVPITFKFAGPITAGSGGTDNLNWFEYYYLRSINGSHSDGTADVQDFTVAGTSNNKFTKPFDNAGEKTFPDYAAYANQYIYDIDVPHCTKGSGKTGKVFVGQRTESFFIYLGGIFDLINFVPIPGFSGAIVNNAVYNDLADKNIGTFALEVPTVCITSDGSTNGVVGAWSVIRQLLHDSTGTTHMPGLQVSRLGNPLINELIIGLRDKYLWNAAQPTQDVTNFGTYVLYPTLPFIVDLLFGDAVRAATGLTGTIAPAVPRNDLLIFVTGIQGLNQPTPLTAPGEMLRLNVATAPLAQASQNTLGVIAGDAAGFPNGRRPGDDVVDIALQVVVAGKLCALNVGCNASSDPSVAPIANVALTDGAPISANDFLNAFPYLNTPLPGAKNGARSTTSSPSSGLTLPSLVAIAVAILAGFLISFGFFA